jgi:hypothetical protein
MKNKWLKRIILIISISIGIFYILNIKVTTQQGINYEVQTIEIPLYLKVLDFFDRHYNYKWTFERIIGDSKTEKEKALKIFKWTYENIKKTPEGYPVIDDHVWHIIVRGYGEVDQSADVFTTICNYADVDAFFYIVYDENRTSATTLSLVKLDGRWCVFDPYNGVYFKNKEGILAKIEDIINENWLIERIGEPKDPQINYTLYLKNLPPINEIGLRRANVQSPINRLRYEIKKWLK